MTIDHAPGLSGLPFFFGIAGRVSQVRKQLRWGGALLVLHRCARALPEVLFIPIRAEHEMSTKTTVLAAITPPSKTNALSALTSLCMNEGLPSREQEPLLDGEFLQLTVGVGRGGLESSPSVLPKPFHYMWVGGWVGGKLGGFLATEQEHLLAVCHNHVPKWLRLRKTKRFAANGPYKNLVAPEQEKKSDVKHNQRPREKKAPR